MGARRSNNDSGDVKEGGSLYQSEKYEVIGMKSWLHLGSVER